MTIEIGTVKRLIHEALTKEPEGLQRIDMGVMNLNFSFKVNGIEYVIRISPLGVKGSTLFEHSLMSVLFKNGCKVPKPVFFSNKGEYVYMIYHYLPGSPLSRSSLTSTQLPLLAKQIVTNLGCIANIKEQDFWPIRSTREIDGDWHNFIYSQLRDGMLNLVQNERLLPVTFDVERIYKNFLKKLKITKFDLIHLIWSDISRDNIIVSGKQLSGFVDFEGCMFGDPTLMLGYLFSVEGESDFFISVHEEFKKHHPIREEMIFFYAVFRIFRMAKYLNQPLPSGTPRDPLNTYFKGLQRAIAEVK